MEPKPHVLIVHNHYPMSSFIDAYIDLRLRDVMERHPAVEYHDQFGDMIRYKVNPRWNVNDVRLELERDLDEKWTEIAKSESVWDAALEERDVWED